jgi:hypothetical protein
MATLMTTRFAPFLLAFLAGAGAPVLAEDLGPQMHSNRGETPEERAEKAAREACKIEICDIIETREQQGADIACDIGWTWRAEEIVNALGGRFDWTWGQAACQTEVKVERAPLAKAMSSPRASLKGETHKVRCAIRQDGKPYVIEVELSPRVTFKNGKATEAKVNWGEVSAPAAIYPLLYAATGLDNSTNVLGPEIVRQVNKFVRKDCAEMAGELPGRRVN